MTIDPSTTAAGSYTVLTVSVPHGCEGSPTTRVAIKIPKEILAVTPTRNPLWDVTKQKQKLTKPVTDAYGEEVTERDAVVVYTARTPLPDGYRDAFELSLQLPGDEGETLMFPAIQTCERGETAWAEVAAEGQDAEELEHPAPAVITTASEEEADTATPSSAEESTADESAEEGGDTLAVIALGVAILGLIAGVTALARARRRG